MVNRKKRKLNDLQHWEKNTINMGIYNKTK